MNKNKVVEMVSCNYTKLVFGGGGCVFKADVP